MHCAAAKSVKFQPGEPRTFDLQDPESGLDGSVPVSVAFRRLYADGSAVVKVELGFALPERLTPVFSGALARSFINHLLTTRLSIRIPGNVQNTATCKAGGLIAAAYARATTPNRLLEAGECPPWWLSPGKPILFWEIGPAEKVKLPGARYVPAAESPGSLRYTEVQSPGGPTIPMWLQKVSTESTRSMPYFAARELRICLLRLHAENECLRLVLRHLASDRLVVQPRTPSSDALQLYLRNATRRITGLGKEADLFSETPMANIARLSVQSIDPTDVPAMLGALKNLDVRKQIFRRLETYLKTEINIQNLNMNNKYNITGGQQGAVGDNASVQKITFNQLVQTMDEPTLAKLVTELPVLKAELERRVKAPEHQAAVIAVGEAEVAARSKDPSKVLASLVKAGKWTLEVAKSIAVPLATKYLESSLGMGN